MISHLIRLAWNRKRQHLLVVIELFLSFAVLFGITFTAVVHYYNWRQPIGFRIDRLLTVQLGYPHAGPERPDATEEDKVERTRAAEVLEQVLSAIRSFPEVERASTSWPTVFYARGGWGAQIASERHRTLTDGHMLSDDMRDVIDMKLTAGRWFSREDDAAAVPPVILNARLARELFGDESPLNKELPATDEMTTPLRVIGLIDDFRHEGELAFPDNAAIFRLASPPVSRPVLPGSITILVRSGTGAEFEERLVRALRAVAPDWTFDARSIESRREEAFRKTIAPIAVITIVAIFLLLMVALGLTGVVWQNVTTRVQEFGLRRAKGATARDIRAQIFMELGVLATAAVAVGAALALQFPPLTYLGPPSIKFISVAVAGGVIYLLTLLCAWYPSRLATRIQPADALHYE